MMKFAHCCNKLGMGRSCEDEVVRQLSDMTRGLNRIASAPSLAHDESFYAQQNARLVRNAEEYYRSMFRGRVLPWNLRDSHMVETLVALSNHLSQGASPPRMAVWAHNSHLGDAGVTDMGDRGKWNVGQLMRERLALKRF
jgi:erythromycin esterase-like protein